MNFVAIIGDIIRSRALRPEHRGNVQLVFAKALQRLNASFAPAIASRFVITVGDEFQGLLRTASVIPDVLWEIEIAMSTVEFRVGIGYGTLTTALKPEAIGMDGPSFHAAREAIVQAKRGKKLGGVFAGFGEHADSILNGYARILWYHRRQWKPTQLEVAQQLRSGKKQMEISEALGISQQAVSSRARSAGWEAYVEAERGWREALREFDEGSQ